MTTEKIFLVGLPASGKSSYAEKLASELNIPFIDLDEEVVKSEGQSIHQIFEKKGEDYFREIERNQLQKIIHSDSKFVLATGGGTPCFFDNMLSMNNAGTTVYLNPTLEEIEQRLVSDDTRPLLRTMSLNELYGKRSSWYEQAQHVVTNFEELKNVFL